MGKRIVSVLLCLCLILPAAGCGMGYKADGEFTYLLPGNLNSLDPQTASGAAAQLVIGSLFEGLCRIDSEGEVVPGVAERWESRNNDTEFTFHLRRDAQWSDGSPVTAQDFLFAIQRALQPETGTPAVDDLFAIQGARAIYHGEAGMEALGVTVEDGHTLVFRLEKSVPDFPALTAAMHYMPCSQSYFEESLGHYGLSSQYLLTNGPFALASVYAWDTDSGERKVSLVRSSTYRGEEQVQPSSVTYLIDYDSAWTQDPVATLTAGEADVLQVTEQEARAAEEAGCGILTLEDAVTGLLLNPQSEKLESVYLREVLFKTLDRQDLLARREDASQAQGIMAACVTYGGEPYYQEGAAAYPQQDDSVTQGLSGLLDGLDLEEMPSVTVICPDDEESVNVANGFLVAWNSQLGTAFNIDPLPQDELQRRVAAGEYEAALYTLRAVGTTPYAVLKSFESHASPVLLNSAAYDEALHGLTFDLASYQGLEQRLLEEYVFYPLFQDVTYYAMNPKVRGIRICPDGSVDLTAARKRG